MNNLNEMLGKISDFLKSETRTETVVGQQFKLGEFTCVPVISVGLGFGAGSGEGKGKGASKNMGEGEGEGTGAGGGGGLGIGPVGFLATKGSEIQFIPVKSSKGMGGVFEKIPDLLEKFIEKKKTAEPQKV